MPSAIANDSAPQRAVLPVSPLAERWLPWVLAAHLLAGCAVFAYPQRLEATLLAFLLAGLLGAVLVLARRLSLQNACAVLLQVFVVSFVFNLALGGTGLAEVTLDSAAWTMGLLLARPLALLWLDHWRGRPRFGLAVTGLAATLATIGGWSWLIAASEWTQRLSGQSPLQTLIMVLSSWAGSFGLLFALTPWFIPKHPWPPRENCAPALLWLVWLETTSVLAYLGRQLAPAIIVGLFAFFVLAVSFGLARKKVRTLVDPETAVGPTS